MSGSIANTAKTAAVLGGVAAGVVAIADAVNLYNRRGSLASRYENSNFSFPLDLSDYYIAMRFRKYVRRSIYQRPFFEDVVGIRLPVPENLVDTTSLDYSKENLGPAFGVAADLASRPGQFDPGALLSRLGNLSITEAISADPASIVAEVLTGTETAQTVAAGAGAQVLQNTLGRLPGATGAISALTGLSFNPFQTVLFKSPNFKTHSFTWRLVPKDSDESEELRKIIEMFRYHSLPGISSAAGIFFSYPEILEIKLYPNDSYTYKFKPCVVDSIKINYAPNRPSFHRVNGAPTAVELSVQLQEIEIWTKNDIPPTFTVESSQIR